MRLPVYVDNHYGKDGPDTLCLLAADDVERLWQWVDPSKSTYLPPGSVRAPRCFVFGETAEGFFFKAGRTRMNVDPRRYLYFHEGQHRTRWLLDAGLPMIPLGINPLGLAVLDHLGVDYQCARPGVVLDLPVTLADILALYDAAEQRDLLLHH